MSDKIEFNNFTNVNNIDLHQTTKQLNFPPVYHISVLKSHLYFDAGVRL